MKPVQPVSDYVIEQPETRPTDSRDAVLWAQRLGYAGLLPFIAPLLVLPFAGDGLQLWVLRALLAYAAVILSFVGALHWSVALLGRSEASSVRLLVVSVLPSLLAWLSLLLPLAQGLLLAMISFLALYAFDRSAWRELPWFLQLRRNLTLVALCCMFIGWLWVRIAMA